MESNRLKRNLSFVVLSFAFVTSVFGGDVCVNCGPKDVTGMPTSGTSMGALEKVAYATSASQDSKSSYMGKYCMMIQQIPPQMVGKMIKDMESSPYSIDDYYKMSECQAERYSATVKSPLLHYIAEDPEGRQDFLENIWLYYSKKRKEPQIFTNALNAKNTKGETLLDYIETLKRRNINTNQQDIIDKMINFLCSHGGTYSLHKDKKCSTAI